MIEPCSRETSVRKGGLRTILATALLASSSCAGEPAAPPPAAGVPAAPRIVDVLDVGNAGGAGDVQVVLHWTGNEAVTHRLYVVESAHTPTFPTGGDFIALPGTEPGNRTVRLTEGTDATGSPLAEDRRYHFFAVAVVGGVSSEPTGPFGPFTLEQEPFIETLAHIDAGTGGMAVGPDGVVYMGDFGPQLNGGPQGTRVYRVEPDGSVGIFASGLSSASGNAFDSQGNLIQANIGGNSISKISPNGQVATLSTSGFNSPVGVAVGPGDTLFVANCGDNTVRRVSPDGSSVELSRSTLLSCPNGIARAPDGALFVSNFFNGNVIRLSPTGAASVFATFPGANLGHITYANDVFYVAVRGNHQIAELGLDGSSRVIAGTGSRGGRDGTATSATLSFPNDVAVSADGRTLYFNDVDPATQGTNNISPAVVRRMVLASGSE